LSDRQSKKEILKLEDDLPQWSELLDLPPSPSFDEGVLAILKGRVVQYIMRTHEVTLGRNSGVKQVTFDLSLEGPAFKISRHQATINMKSDGSFVIKNVGRRSLFLGGHAIVTGETGQLKDNQVLEISSFSLLILLNPKATPPSIPT
jgi:microspherule protein 1